VASIVRRLLRNHVCNHSLIRRDAQCVTSRKAERLQASVIQASDGRSSTLQPFHIESVWGWVMGFLENAIVVMVAKAGV
jgi:hypothetical protein